MMVVPGFIVAALYPLVRERMHIFMSLFFPACLVYWAIEVYRFVNPSFNKKFLRSTEGITRKGEENRLTSSFFYVVGVAVSLASFPADIAVMGLYCLAVCDPVAGLTGIMFGHLGPKISRKKSAIGTGFCALSGVIVSWIHLHYLSPTTAFVHRGYLASVAGTVSAIAELVDLGLDDNLQVPILTGVCLTLAASILQEPALTLASCNEYKCDWLFSLALQVNFTDPVL